MVDLWRVLQTLVLIGLMMVLWHLWQAHPEIAGYFVTCLHH